MVNQTPRIMSHFGHKTRLSKALLSMSVLSLVAVSVPPVTAQAGPRTIEYPGLKTPQGKSEIRTVSLAALSATSDNPIRSEKPVLDWRRPSYALKFDVPDTEWTSSLRLTLSADPVRNAPRNAEFYVQLNQATPVKVETQGRGFDARLSLEKSALRSRGNILKLFYKAPKSSACLSELDGAWALNLQASHLTLRSRTKSRPLIISDIEAELSNPFTAPDRVSLISYGSSATQIQSLLAQAVGLRMQETPLFSAGSHKGQFKNQIEFIAGRRDQISGLVNNVYMMSVPGPVLTLDEGHPMRVILTGDTDEEVLSLVQAFATHHLPQTRRALVSSSELIGQSLLASDPTVSEGRTNLAELGPTTFNPDWNPKDLTLRFNAEDPLASKGDILLRLATPKELVSEKNTLRLTLNAHAIGQTELDKVRKSVSFQVPQGLMQGQNNILKMSANITAETGSETLQACRTHTYTPNGLFIENSSHLALNPVGKTPLSDLSHLTATGAPFSDAQGKHTLLVLPKNQAEYQAALGLLAKLAKTSGGTWSEAAFTREGDQIELMAKNRNVFFILPPQDIPEKVKSTAPKSFLSALRGKTDNGENLLTATAERYASTQTNPLGQDFAAKAKQRNHVSRGGVAALYASPYQSDKMIGVISNIPGDSFVQALEQLSEPVHWNKIEGQVARWNEKSVLMTELSSPLSNFKRTVSTPGQSKWEWFGWDGFRGNISEINWPEVDFSKTLFTLPEIHLPEIDVSSWKEKMVFWKPETDIAPSFSQASAYAPSISPSATNSVSSLETGVTFLDKILDDKATEPIKQETETVVSEVSRPELHLAYQSPAPNLGKESPFKRVRNQIKSIRNNWRSNLKRASLPGRHISGLSLSQLSAVGLLSFLSLGVLFVLLGFTAPRNRTDKRP